MTPGQQVQMRLTHLTLVQGVIGCMAGYSAAVKTFCVTLVAAVCALTSSGKAVESLLWFRRQGRQLARARRKGSIPRLSGQKTAMAAYRTRGSHAIYCTNMR